MKKLQMLLVLAVGVLLASCGGKDNSADSELDSYVEAARKGFLGEKGGEIMEHFTKLEVIRLKVDKLMNKEIKTDAEAKKYLEEVDEPMGKLIEDERMVKEQWKERVKELEQEIVNMEIPTEVENGVPLELLKPFTLTQFGYELFQVSAQVKMLKDRPAIHNSAHKAKPSGYYYMKVVVGGSKDEPTDTILVTNVGFGDLKAGTEMKVTLRRYFHESFLNPSTAYFEKSLQTVHLLSAKKLRIIWEHPIEEIDLQPGRGDLGGYDLRGPVKKVTYAEWNATFDELGQLTHENGRMLKNLFPGGVKRDKDGRLTECNADGYGSRSYTYNDMGLPTEINEDGFARQMTYDADGYVATETSTVAPEMGDEEGEPEVITNKYTILEKDSYGNWTKRKDQEGNVTTRSITYFN